MSKQLQEQKDSSDMTTVGGALISGIIISKNSYFWPAWEMGDVFEDLSNEMESSKEEESVELIHKKDVNYSRARTYPFSGRSAVERGNLFSGRLDDRQYWN